MRFFPRFRRVYQKLAAVFLLVLLVIGGLQLTTFLRGWQSFLLESEQRAHWGLAESLARRISPYVQDPPDYQGLDELIAGMLVPPTRFDLYIIDRDGVIRFHPFEPWRVMATEVPMAPIRRFLEGEPIGSGAILGMDPKHPDRPAVFSAAPMQFRGEPAYLYIMLGVNDYGSVLSVLGESYFLRSTIIATFLSLAAAAAAGLFAFYLLTNPLRRLAAGVEQFKAGSLDSRVNTDSGDEFETLSETFNEMARTIQEKIEELQHQDQLRRELIANISHDLRSPLAAVRSSLDTVSLQFNLLSEPELRRYLDASLGSLDFLQNLVTELFELSKLEARVVQPQREPLSIADLCDDVVTQLQPNAAEKRISLMFECPQEPPLVSVDTGMIAKVLVNLVGNAIRYTPEGGSVVVEAAVLEAGVRVSVADTGVGIPEEALPRIFDRFFRVEQSRTKDMGGTGLGLAIVKRILEAHEVDIRVESRPDEGTTFYFILPFDTA